MHDKKIPCNIPYVWLGKKEKPPLVKKCIASWKEKMPYCSITEWNEDNLDLEKEMKKYTFLKDFLKLKAWAFFADYFRLKILYEQGGLYLDTDMEVIKDIKSFFSCEMFLGFEQKNRVACGIIGSVPKHILLKKILCFYRKKYAYSAVYLIPDVFNVHIKNIYGAMGYDKNNVTKLTPAKGKGGSLSLFPECYFYPFYYDQKFSPKCISEKTHTIHWWHASWKNEKIQNYLSNRIRKTLKQQVMSIKWVSKLYFGIKTRTPPKIRKIIKRIKFW